MRILIVSPFQPHPDADHGGGAYLGLLVEALRPHAELATVHYRHRNDRPELKATRVYNTPRAADCELPFFARALRRGFFLWEWGLRGFPLEVAKLRSAAFRKTLRRAVTDFAPDVVLVEFAVMAWCLDELSGVKTVLTDHEAGASVPRHFGPGNLGGVRDRRLWPRYVRHFYPMANLLQTLTEPDAKILGERLGRQVAVRPTLVQIPESTADVANSPPVMLFFGDYRHHPNPESAEVLARDVLPLVRRELEDAELWLAGPRADARVQRLADLDGVRVLGFVEDLASLFGGTRCLVAPVYSGSGVRTKVIHAMAHGLPVVANELGLQAIAAPDDAVRRGETPAELAAASLAFLMDADRAAAAGAAARAFVVATVSGEKIVADQLARIAALP